ncbi:hypothetical protein QBC37DRAFT_376322 [Rhypophila decipiens]|uniref:Uncharacterized protein n=1 Tax=Rhypophila decipiens TaxID=261697 RepID=A0AAN7B7R3_9PEZI|nr:hypothetical protein QBC37DRAFT_376322 [Rhypophila decipiens]
MQEQISRPQPVPALTTERDSESLLQDARRSTSASNHIGRPLESRSRLELVGNTNVIILVLGFAVSFAVALYILFLWQLSPAYGFTGWESRLWKTIALNDKVGLSITISSAMLRLTMALQLGVALSMTAGLFLEDATTPLRFIPLVLMLRGSGKGSTRELVIYLSHTFRSNLFLNLIVAAMLLTTTLSQLASTFLVSDLGQGYFLDNPRRQDIAYGLRPAPNVKEDAVVLEIYQESTADVQYWTSGPAAYPIFAEYSEPPPQWGPGIQDTGVNLRALPPFRSADQRASLQEYDGYTAVFDTRVTCLTPVVHSDLVVGFTYTPMWTTAQLSGHAHVVLPPHIRRNDPEVSTSKRTVNLAFNCSVSLPGVAFEEQAASDWAITICDLDGAGIKMDTPLQLDNNIWKYLVINATGRGEQWQESEDAPWTVSNLTDPWTRLSLPTKGPSLSLSMSICMNGLNKIDIPTKMTRSGTPPYPAEPTMSWDDTLRAYDTSKITNLYAGGMMNLSDSSRGIMRLAKRSNWTQDYIFTRKFVYDSMAIKQVSGLWVLNDDNIGVMMCTFCENHADSVFRAHRLHVVIFQDILKKTNNLALAIQTLFTILAQRVWYDFLNEFTVSAEASFTFSADRLIPVRNGGMSVVIGIIWVHNLAVIVIAVLFFSRQRISMVGNLWQGFGQVVAGDVADLAARSTAALDKEVVRELEKYDDGVGEVVELIRDVKSGDVRLQRRRRSYV